MYRSFLIYAQNMCFFFGGGSLTILLSSSSRHPTPQKIIYIYNICLPHAFAFLKLEHLFCLSHHKTRWTILVNNVGLKICLLGTLNSMVTVTFFPWCKPKLSQDEFNKQSQI
jgi:hypothetical protein